MNSIFLQNLKLVRSTLRKSRLRTALSVLGIAIGILALVVIMSAGKSLQQVFEAQLDSFATDYIEVEIKIPNTSQESVENAAGIAQGISITTLTLDDKEDIDKLENVKASYGAVFAQGTVSSLFEENTGDYMAVSAEFDAIDPAEIASGRFFTADEEDGLAKVIVLGSKAAEELFPNQDAVGQTLKLQKTRFKVIGVFEERGALPFFDMDAMMFVPLKTAQKLVLGFDHLLAIFVQLNDVTQDKYTADDVRQILRVNHNITDPDKDDFAVTTQAEALDTINVILDGVTLVISVIASIALVVGGVGIMNIMYVAVSERFFEIGLRKAVGATKRDIMSQFLVEAASVTLLGGVVGIVTAMIFTLLIYYIANWQGFDWPLAISVESIFIAIIFSSLVGLTFGFLPARKAARLDPVAALTGRKN